MADAAKQDPAHYHIEKATSGIEQIARTILESLPEWFGRPDARDRYIAATAELPTFLAYTPDGCPAGFLSLAQHTSVSAEVYVIAVLRTEHGRGCGRQLIEHACEYARAGGVRWLTVKTLAASHPDPNYAATRRFYEANGFEPLEVFETLWGENTPCLLMLKPLT